jgi:FAD/FMN-containing dehydrogenase
MLQQGFALALDVVHATGRSELIHVAGPDADPYVHNYGTAGIIARATVALEPMLHLEAQKGRPIGMLVGEYRSPDAVYAGFDRLGELGVSFHNPHQWYVDYLPERTRALAATTDPDGLLNPGKLVAATVVTGSQR